MEQPLILGRYRPLEVKGKGGFSTVEVAYDTRIQRRVAIKHIPFDGYSPKKAPGLTEARTAAMLANPFIVQVYDFECEDDEALLIMEYIDGPTLSEVIEQEGGFLDLDEIAYVVKGIAGALDYAHENQVLHLDIKPDNILIDHNGFVKVADFGIAELADAAGFASASGGTIGYMPPEQIMGEELDQRTDEWAFAAVIYEMLTGENPFIAANMENSLRKIDAGDITEPSAFRDDLDPEIDGIILDALSPDKAIRFETVFDFVQALLPYLGEPEIGHEVLRELINPLDEEDDIDVRMQLGLWDRIGEKGRTGIDRFVACLASAWIVWLGASIGFFPWGISITLVAAVAIGSILAPQLSIILAILIFSVGLFIGGVPWLGIGFGLIGIAWWLFSGRKNSANTIMPFAAPLCTLLYLSPLYPLVCGFCLNVRRTLVTMLFSSCLMLVVCACTGSASLLNCGFLPADAGTIMSTFLSLVTSYSTWILLIGWVFAAVLMSALCGYGSKMVSIVGSALGCVLMLGILMLADYMTSGFLWSFPTVQQGLMIGFALVAMCIITALGAPYHGEEEYEEE